ncbi:hypothetical protein EDB83DRAFT_2328157, partial [Lactarius deliciosus]
HLRKISPECGGYGPQIGGLALATAAVERALTLFRTGEDISQVNNDDNGGTMRASGHRFTEALWGPSARAFVRSTEQLMDCHWEEILDHASKYLRGADRDRNKENPEGSEAETMSLQAQIEIDCLLLSAPSALLSACHMGMPGLPLRCDGFGTAGTTSVHQQADDDGTDWGHSPRPSVLLAHHRRFPEPLRAFNNEGVPTNPEPHLQQPWQRYLSTPGYPHPHPHLHPPAHRQRFPEPPCTLNNEGVPTNPELHLRWQRQRYLPTPGCPHSYPQPHPPAHHQRYPEPPCAFNNEGVPTNPEPLLRRP